MIEIVPADTGHVRAIVPNLRDADKIEVYAQSGQSAGIALLASVSVGKSETALMDGEPVAMFGVSPLSVVTRSGVPWLVGTGKLLDIPATFARVSRAEVNGWMEKYDYLINHVDARKSVSIRWLQWLGFTIHDAEPHGPFGVAFHKFDWSR